MMSISWIVARVVYICDPLTQESDCLVHYLSISIHRRSIEGLPSSMHTRKWLISFCPIVLDITISGLVELHKLT